MLQYDSYYGFLPESQMLVTDKGQVTIPKHIRVAAGVVPGSEVSFSLEGSRILMTPLGTGVKDDRREKLRAAATSSSTRSCWFGAKHRRTGGETRE